MPSTASVTATSPSCQTGPSVVEPAHPDGERHRDDRLQHRHEAEREAVAEDEVALAERRRHEPLERARAALAQGRDRGDQEHDDEREQRQDRRPVRVEHALLVAEQPGEQADEQARGDEHERDRPGVVAQLAQHAAGGGDGADAVHFSASPRASRRVSGWSGGVSADASGAGCGSGLAARRASAADPGAAAGSGAAASAARVAEPPPHHVAFDEREERGIRILLTRVGEQAVRSRVGDDAAGPHEDEPVAAERLVHDVAADDERRAAVGEGAEQSPQLVAQHRVEADGRLVEHDELGLAEHRDGERDAALLPAAQGVDASAAPGLRGRPAR